MKPVLALLALVLAACATVPRQPAPSPASAARVQLDNLRTALPGAYSNFAQIHADNPGGPVTEVVVRHLTDGREAAFLFSRRFRGGESARHQLYWFREGGGPDMLEARFAPLGEEQLTHPVPQILAAAAARFRAGCELALAVTADGLVGQTDPAGCRFPHPQGGDAGLVREWSFGRGRLSIAERVLDSAGNRIGEDGILHLQKHRRYQGWAGTRASGDFAPGDPGAWRLAQPFAVLDDGSVTALVDAAGDPLEVGLQLARIRWRADQPPILRLAVIRMADAAMLAYSWSDPDARRIGVNLDWFQAGLEAVTN